MNDSKKMSAVFAALIFLLFNYTLLLCYCKQKMCGYFSTFRLVTAMNACIWN